MENSRLIEKIANSMQKEGLMKEEDFGRVKEYLGWLCVAQEEEINEQNRGNRGGTPVMLINEEGKDFTAFWSMSETAEALNTSTGVISDYIKNKKPLHGYYFRKATREEAFKKSKRLGRLVYKTTPNTRNWITGPDGVAPRGEDVLRGTEDDQTKTPKNTACRT